MSARARVVSATVRQALTRHATCHGSRITITHQLPPEAWQDVRTVLEAIEGVYVPGGSTFEFPAGVNAAEQVAAALQAGRVMAPAHADGFVATPADLAYELVTELAELGEQRPSPLRVLEPSAGTGRLVAAVLEHRAADVEVVAVEPNPRRAAQIPTDDRVRVVTGTFEDFAVSEREVFDRVVMNPPFAVPGRATLWASHLLLAWQLLAPGGRLVAIVPASVLRPRPRGRDVAAVVALVRDHGRAELLDEDAFVESGTTVRTAVVRLDRPPAAGTGATAGTGAVVTASAGYLVREYPRDWTAVRVSRPFLTRGAAGAAPVQVWTDPWRDVARVLRYWGDCAGCGTTTWAFDDGANDPRGPLGDASAGWSLDPDDYGMAGPSICLCATCGNDAAQQDKALAVAERHWTGPREPAARADADPLLDARRCA